MYVFFVVVVHVLPLLIVQAKTAVATKANPWGGKTFSAECLTEQMTTSFASLQCEAVDLYYLHAPDVNTPIATTLASIDSLHKAGKFKRFGLSNFPAWQVAQICGICDQHNYVKPTVYQGMYNAITRDCERELFPCLRAHNIAFYAYNPLAGGVLTGKYADYDASMKEQPTGRFFGNNWAEIYRKRFLTKNNIESINRVQACVKEVYGDKVTMAGASIRWFLHHSLSKEHAEDALIVGASTSEQFVQNMDCTRDGPLDAKVVAAFDQAWCVWRFSFLSC